MKTKYLTFRVTPDEHLRFLSISKSFDMEATEYFRSKFLSLDNVNISTFTTSTDELTKRAKAAETIIIQSKLEKDIDPDHLERMVLLNEVNFKLHMILNYIYEAEDLAPRSYEKIIKEIITVEELIKGAF